MTRGILLVFMLCLALLASGCGGDDGGGTDEPTAQTRAQESGDDDAAAPPPEEGSGGEDGGDDAEAVEKVYAAYFDAIKSGDGDAACDLLTEDYQQQVIREAEQFSDELQGVDCAQAATAFASVSEDYEPRLRNIEVTGDKATGRDPGQGQFEPQIVTFERVGGEWKISSAG